MTMAPGRYPAVSIIWALPLVAGFLLLLAAIVRLQPVLASSLPVGDGGLFVVMIEAVGEAGLGVPASVVYGGEEIPFVYPPLPFLVGAAITVALGVPPIEVVHYLPALLSLAAVPLVFVLAGRLIAVPIAAYAAMAAWGLMPAAYDWLVAGGGLSRSMGMLLALAAMCIAARPRIGPRGALATGILLGATALSHPQVAIFCVLSVALIWGLVRRDAWPAAPVAVGAALVVVVPWLALLALRGQLDALLAAGQRWSPLTELVTLLGLHFSGTEYFNVFLGLGLVGVLVQLIHARWLIPTWIVLTYLAGGGLFMVTVPWALACAVATRHLADAWVSQAGHRNLLVPISVAALLVLMAVGATGWSYLDPLSKRHAVTDEQAAAMRWVSAEAPTSATFAVVSTESWTNDLFGEWFPMLARRPSLATPQGTEWLGRDVFTRRTELHARLEACAPHTSDCLADVMAAEPIPATHVVVPKGQLAGPLAPQDCCPALRQTLLEDARFEVVYEGPGATIARWRGGHP